MKRKIVGIISGKGGVGKTSLTASLASLAQHDEIIRIIAMDCDVDAPNLAIILPSKENSKINTKDMFTALKSEFIEKKCIKCKKCIDDHYCEFNALKWDSQNSIPIIDYLKCEGCGACKVLCSEHAFDIHPVKSGEIISYISKNGFLVIYGKTQLGSTTSGKLVSDVKEYTKNFSEYEECDLVLIDGPPGIGCPVIATISGLDYAITICEPTPSGLHDMIRAIEVIQQFNIPYGIIINKYDLKSSFQSKFREYMENKEDHLLGKIPFDLTIPKAMSFAEPVVEFMPDSKASLAIKEIYENLKKVLWN